MTKRDLPEIGSRWVSRPRGQQKRWGQTILEVTGYHFHPETNYPTVEVKVLKCDHTPEYVGKTCWYDKGMMSYDRVVDEEGDWVDVISPRT